MKTDMRKRGLRTSQIKLQVTVCLCQSEDDVVDILPEVIEKRKAKGPRQSVSAEAFGKFNKKEDFKARIIPKTEQVK